MIYDFDVTTLDGGRSVHCEVFNARSGRTLLHKRFSGPFRALRASTWGARYARLLEWQEPTVGVSQGVNLPTADILA